MRPVPHHGALPPHPAGAPGRTPTNHRPGPPSWAYLAAAACCGVLVPALTALGASLEGAHAFGRVVVAGAIAVLAGLTIAASAAAVNAADRAEPLHDPRA